MYKTVGGGHCIQFTEVETLKTRSDELTSPGRYVSGCCLVVIECGQDFRHESYILELTVVLFYGNFSFSSLNLIF